MLKNSPNATLNKAISERYNDLPMPEGSLIATYIWIDGTGENLRCKDRTITSIPESPKGKLCAPNKPRVGERNNIFCVQSY